MEQISLNKETSFELDQETLLDVFSYMHVEQGFRIMDHWGIPPLYSGVVAGHHNDEFNPDDILLAIVRLVNFKSVQYDLNLYPQFFQPLDVSAEIDALSVSEEDLEQLEATMSGSCD
jgi:hypothetical protein